MAKTCPRDHGGFCRIALIGHRLCPTADGGCRVTDPDAVWEELRQRAIAKLSAKVRRLKREARRRG